MKIPKLLLVAFLFVNVLVSQNSFKTIADFKSLTKASVTVNPIFQIPEFISFPKAHALKIEGVSLNEKALGFLSTNKTLFKLEDVDVSFKTITKENDTHGFFKLVLQQQYNNVPVYDGKLLFHFNTLKNLTAINGNFIPNIKLNAIPSLSKDVANAMAIDAIESQDINLSRAPLFVQESKLLIFNKGLAKGVASANYLVYKVEVRNNIDVRAFLFIDAHTGVLIAQYAGIAHALDRAVFEGNVGNPIWQEGDDFPGSLTSWQQNEVVASGHVYHFFNNAFSYASYDGADAQMRTINNSANLSCPNASWNGSTTNYCDGTASDDVIAHEWGHAYTGSTSGLIYQWQSGAINESYSDIWGETIDLLNNYEDLGEDNSIRTSSNTCGTANRWKIAEDASAFGGSIRDMWNPNCSGDPGKLTDTQYFCGSGDNGGVHINSSIPNHAYALFVDGGTYNGFTITGVGFTKAAHIFWRAQSQYLTATSDFNTLADALQAAATDLLGINLEGLSTTEIPAGLSGEIITTADITQLNNALLAVELRVNPDVCSFQTVLASSAPLCEVSSTNPIYIEDWETGLDGWTLNQITPSTATWTARDWEIETSLPNNRAGSGIYAINAPIGDLYGGDCASDFQNGILRLESPTISIPDFNTGTYELAFNHYVSTEPDWDGGNLKISIDGSTFAILPAAAFTTNPYNGTINTQAAGNDNPMRGEIAFTGTDEGSNTGSWGTTVIDLSSLGINANSTLQIRFEFGTDGCNGREGWYLDEFIVYNCDYTMSLAVNDFEINAFKVFPNPSKGIFNLKKTNQVNLIKAEIYDINGRVIHTINLLNMNVLKLIDLTEVAAGLYFMTVTSTKNQSVVKLLVEK